MASLLFKAGPTEVSGIFGKLMEFCYVSLKTVYLPVKTNFMNSV